MVAQCVVPPTAQAYGHTFVEDRKRGRKVFEADGRITSVKLTTIKLMRICCYSATLEQKPSQNSSIA